MQLNHPLDNPVWSALHEVHQEYRVEYDGAVFYKPQYTRFGAVDLEIKKGEAVSKYGLVSPNLFVVDSKEPFIPKGFFLKAGIECYQMVANKKVSILYKDEIVKLSDSDFDYLHQLVDLAYPEFFESQTTDLGTYFGIYKNKELLAITGERMQTNDFIEVSGVITHPNHFRNGYAKQLVAKTASGIFEKSKTPFLHVATTNSGAIKLYQKLGFEIRKTIVFWNIIKS